MSEKKLLPERPAPPPRGTAPGRLDGGNGEESFPPTARVEGPDDASMRATVAIDPGGDAATVAVERGGDRDTVAMPWDDDPLDIDVDADADADAGNDGDTRVQPASPDTVPPGLRSVRRVGRYLIRERLGRGGMGTVFKAHDPSIGRDVAIKFLHIALCQDKGGRARFLREARAAGRLSHPNIVTVHDVGEIDGRPYMAMELLEGPPLSAEMAGRTALPLREAVAVGIQLARTLDYAHARGVVHRDIKPGNIMRAAEAGAIKVTDFGIAHMEAAGAEQRTRVGAILGTPQYMSPEQAQGKKLDGRSDLFSAGIVLYEMLAGQRPFAGDGLVAVAVNIVRDKPLPIDTLRPELPPSLCRVVARCLEKEPERRFQTGQELAEALERVQGEIDETVRRKSEARGLSLGVKWTAAMALAVAAVMVMTTVWVAQRQHSAMVDQVVDAGAAMSRFLAAQNALAALAEDWTAVDVAVQEVMKTGDFHSVVVADRDGVVRAAGDAALVGQRYAPPAGAPLEPRANGVDVSRHGAAGATVLDFRAPITFQGKRVGSVALGLAEEPLARVQRLSNGLMALLVLVTLVAVALAMYFVVGRFARPMEVLGAAMAEIEQGRFEHRIGERRNDEFGRLYAAFDRMARSLHEHRGEALEAAGTGSVAAAVRIAGPPGRMSDEKPGKRPAVEVAPALTPVPSDDEAGPFRAPG